MNNAPIVGALSLALSLGLALGPTGVSAGGLHDGRVDIRPGGSVAPPHSARHTIAGRPIQSNRFGPNRFGRHQFDRRHFSHRHFTGLGFSTLAYVATPGYYETPDYGVYDMPDPYAASVAYGQPAMTAAIAPAPPPAPSVVEYSTGRYELRGDGMSVPYTWVWVPNAPPPPPSAPPAIAQAQPSASAADDARPAKQRQLYRWTDDQNVIYWTDNPESVPDQYRARLKEVPLH
jgi:hypothetical protein